MAVCGLLLLSFEFISQAHLECKWVISGSAMSDLKKLSVQVLQWELRRVEKGINTVLRLPTKSATLVQVA